MFVKATEEGGAVIVRPKISIDTWRSLAGLLDPAGTAQVCPADLPRQAWLAVFQLATSQLVAPALYAVLAARGQLGAVPAEVSDALETLARLNTQRNRRLRMVLRDTLKVLNEAGIEPVLLKGAIALVPDQYPHAFARMMSDLDIGVTEAEAGPAMDALRAADFYVCKRYAERVALDPMRSPSRSQLSPHHLAPLFHPSGHGYVEVHRKLLGWRVPPTALPLPSLRARARRLEWDGVQAWIPDVQDRLMHNALHHQIQDRAFASGQWSLRQLLEFAQLRGLPEGGSIDWAAILQGLDTSGAGDALRAQLLATHRLFGQALPEGVGGTPAARWAEIRFRFRLEHRRLGALLRLPGWAGDLVKRLPNLPARLLNPAWYPLKLRSLKARWRPKPFEIGSILDE